MRYYKYVMCVFVALILLFGPIGLSIVSISVGNDNGEVDVDKIAVEHDWDTIQQESAEEENGVLPTRDYYADKLTQEMQMSRDRFRYFTVFGLTAAAVMSLFIVLRFVANAKNYSAADIIAATALIFILFGTIIVVIIADVDEQLTAAVGIMGAIAGYLFGTMRTGADAQARSDEVKDRPSKQNTQQY